jgi:uncharacterized membrane protein (UPF0127 family)
MASNRMNPLAFAALLAAAASGLAGCSPSPSGPATERLEIAGETFTFEIAADDASRIRGLGGRASLAADEGMLFIFPDAQMRSFWMYDCVIPIDIAYLDPLGTVTAVYTMPHEPPRGENESEADYTARLPRYPSRFPAQFVLEFPAGTIERIGLAPMTRVDLDTRRLKTLAR